jgi:hypothetical protein
MIPIGAGEDGGARWEPNTIVDGINVGGKFKPKDGQGRVVNPKDPAAEIGADDVVGMAIERAKQIAQLKDITPEDAIEVATSFGKILDTAAKETKDKIAISMGEAAAESQTAFLNAMYSLNIIEPPPPPAMSLGEVFAQKTTELLANTEACLKDPSKFQEVLRSAMPEISATSGLLLPEILFGIILGETMPAIIVSFFSYQAMAAVAEQIKASKDHGDKPEDPLMSVGSDLAIMLASDALAIGVVAGITKAKPGLAKAAQSAKQAGAAANKTIATANSQLDINGFALKAKQTKDTIIGVLDSIANRDTKNTPRKRQQTATMDIASKSSTDPARAHLFQCLSAYTAADKAATATSASVMNSVRMHLGDPKITQSLEKAGIDRAKLTARLAKMADIDAIPLQHRRNRASEIEQLIQRIKELPKALDLEGDDADQIEHVFTESVKKIVSAMPKPEQDKQRIIAEAHLGGMFDKTHGAKWRIDAINAEVEHGEKIDRILHSASKPASENHLDDLLHSLRKNDTPVQVTAIDRSKVGEALKGIASPESIARILKKSYAAIEPVTKEVREAATAVTDKSIEAIEMLSQLSANPIAQKLQISANPKARAFTVGNFIELGQGTIRHTWHETAHVLEKENEEIYRRMAAFRSARSKESGGGIVDMEAKGMAGEMAATDKFSNQYCGKIYPIGAKSTELFSTGIESLTSVERIIEHALQDREHLLLSIGCLNVKQKS